MFLRKGIPVDRGWKRVWFYTGHFVSQAGNWVYVLVLPIIVMRMIGSKEDSATALSLIYAVCGIAALIGGIFAPAATNRAAKTYLLIGLNIVMALFSFAIAMVNMFDGPGWLLILCIVLKVGLGGMYLPVDNVLMSELFPKSNSIEFATRKRSLLANFSRLTVYVTSSLLLYFVSLTLLLLLDAISFLVIAAVFYFCLEHKPPVVEKKNLLSLWGRGFKFLGSRPVFAKFLGIYGLLVLQGALNIGLTPAWVKDQGWSISELAWIFAAGGAGGILGSLGFFADRIIRFGLTFSMALYIVFSVLLPFTWNVTWAMIAYFLIVAIYSPMFVRIGIKFIQIKGSVKNAVVSLQAITATTIIPFLILLAVLFCSRVLEYKTFQTMALLPCVVFVIYLLIYCSDSVGLSKLYSEKEK